MKPYCQERITELEQVVESLILQFGYRGVKDGKPIMHTGGLSALEDAFEALGWNAQHEVPDVDGAVSETEASACHKQGGLE